MTDRLREALERVTDALDKMGDEPDVMVSPDVWKRLKAEDAIKQAREALSAPSGAGVQPTISDRGRTEVEAAIKFLRDENDSNGADAVEFLLAIARQDSPGNLIGALESIRHIAKDSKHTPRDLEYIGQIADAALASAAIPKAGQPSDKAHAIFALAEKWVDARVEGIRKNEWGPSQRQTKEDLWDACIALASHPQPADAPQPSDELPPLPEPDLGMPWRVNAKSDGAAHASGFTVQQMWAYARAALASRTNPQQAEGWTFEKAGEGKYIAKHQFWGAGLFDIDDSSARLSIAAALVKDLIAARAAAAEPQPDKEA